MPKGHPISVPRTWPGHRDYEPPEVPASKLFDAIRRGAQSAGKSLRPVPRYPDLGQHDDITQERLDDPEPERRWPTCPVPGGTCLLCDDDHCRELL